jgi:hypothetical protein
MIDERERYERAFQQFQMTEPAWEILVDRRDRKRRNKRITAGVVGIAVFVAAVWIVTSGLSLDRSEMSVVPGGDVTGQVENGPTFTQPGTGGHRFRIPPAGTAVSTPVEGELIAEANVAFAGQVRVYADGRVLSSDDFGVPGSVRFLERRLSPEGVELVRSGAIQARDLLPSVVREIPASAWADREAKPYVPARYGLCFRLVDIPLDVEAVLNQLPESAQALLRGSNPAWNRRCLVVTPEEARSLEEILSDALSSLGDLSSGLDVGVWSPRDSNDAQFIRLRPLFPDGRRFFDCCPY